MPRLPLPTPGELEILRALWARGSSTVREVQRRLRGGRTGYTTVLKLLQIMKAKGLVTRDETGRSHVYAPRLDEAETGRRLAAGLADRAFGGSAAQLVLHALSGKPSSPAELREIRALVDRLERTPR